MEEVKQIEYFIKSREDELNLNSKEFAEITQNKNNEEQHLQSKNNNSKTFWIVGEIAALLILFFALRQFINKKK